jgi:hypothetical protein
VRHFKYGTIKAAAVDADVDAGGALVSSPAATTIEARTLVVAETSVLRETRQQQQQQQPSSASSTAFIIVSGERNQKRALPVHMLESMFKASATYCVTLFAYYGTTRANAA